MPVIDEKQELAKKADLATKQDTLIPGTNITIAADGKTISAAGGGSTVSVTPVLSTGTRIAAIEVDGTIYTLFAPTPPSVSVTQIQQSGVELARVTIDNTPYSIYAPEGSAVLSGTSAPTAAQGENGDLYVQYTVTSGIYTVNMTYVKLNGAWVELSAGGGGGLPENWTVNESYLRANASTDTNELGWGIHDDSYYYDTAATVYNHNRGYKKSNAIPALGGLVKCGGWIAPIFTSTDASATNVDSWGVTPTAFQYNGKTWYWGGGLNGAWGQMDNVVNIEYIGEFDTWQAGAIWLIENSGVYFDDYANTFNQIMEPSTGYLFAGGGTQNNLSDATFKVTTEGEVNGTDFKVSGSSILAPFTGSDGSTAGAKGMVPAPTASDNTKFLKGDGTWAAAGAVDDVEVNGVSVVDANKVAQITSYKEVSKAQYDALPASKLTDNVLYCINDQATADTTVAPIIYSTDEREIGVWTNGKPLYQKTFSISNITVDSWQSITHSISNLSEVVKFGGDFQRNSDGNIFSVPYIEAGSVYIAVQVSSTLIYYRVNGITTGKINITIQYTKTTDAPGSGKWAPSGVPAVHYSTSEQVVGTWADGSTLYEKTVYFNDSDLISESNGAYLSINIPNIKNAYSTNILLSGTIPITYYQNSNLFITGFIGISINAYEFHFRYGSSVRSDRAAFFNNSIITLRYTKTTS